MGIAVPSAKRSRKVHPALNWVFGKVTKLHTVFRGSDAVFYLWFYKGCIQSSIRGLNNTNGVWGIYFKNNI